MERGIHFFKRRALFLMLVLFISIVHQTIVHSLLLSKNCWRNSCLGFLLLIERSLEGFFFIFLSSRLEAKHPVVLLGVAVRVHYTTFINYFQRRSPSFDWDIRLEAFQSILQTLASRPTLSIALQCSSIQILRYFERSICSGALAVFWRVGSLVK